jgi:hypothetical protein
MPQFRMRLMDRYRRLVLADFLAEERGLKDGKYYEIPFNALKAEGGVRVVQRWSFHLRFGFMRWIDLRYPDGTRSQNIFWRPLWVFPFRLLFWRKAWMRKFTQGLTFEAYKTGDEHRPIDYSETLIEGQKGDPHEARIKYLVSEVLEYVDQRSSEEGGSKLYKDSKDSRLWQLTNAPDSDHTTCRLAFVTQEQWIYFYREKKEGTKGEWGHEEEVDFYQSLEEDALGGDCADQNCSSPRVKYSSLCREHHFEAIRGHLKKEWS